MKYIIMLMIVIGLALADFATGWIKAYCNFNSHAHVERDRPNGIAGKKFIKKLREKIKK